MSLSLFLMEFLLHVFEIISLNNIAYYAQTIFHMTSAISTLSLPSKCTARWKITGNEIYAVSTYSSSTHKCGKFITQFRCVRIRSIHSRRLASICQTYNTIACKCCTRPFLHSGVTETVHIILSLNLFSLPRNELHCVIATESQIKCEIDVRNKPVCKSILLIRIHFEHMTQRTQTRKRFAGCACLNA